MKKAGKFAAFGAAFGIMAGVTFQGVNVMGNHLFGSGSSVESASEAGQAKLSTTSVVAGESSGSNDVSTIAEQVLPSIVAIDVTAHQTNFTPFGRQEGESQGSGSGIIISEKNNKMYIATNNHVIEDADSVTIKFNDDSTAEATVKGTDSATDLAVVEVDMTKLSKDTLSNVKIATIGNSDETKVGEQAIAIGNALGFGTSVTVGYVSAKDKEIDSEDSASVKLLQTDAAINPGNSGGALVNSKGEVIGINSSKFASEEIEGMGFAIPMATAEPILEELMNQKSVSESDRAYLGITGQDVSSEYAEAYGMPEGIYVSQVTSGSPAEKAGVKTGYIITGINGNAVKNMEQLQEKLSRCEAGEKGTLTVVVSNDGEAEEKNLQVTFGRRESTQN